MRLRTEDNVMVIRGRDKGKQGRIQQVFVKQGKILVEGINMVKRHQKPQQGVAQGGIIQKELPLRIENVMLVCPNCTDPSRLGFRFLADGTKARFCKKCEEVIE